MFEDKTQHNLKYIQDLADDTTNYVSQLILNIYNGVSENLGVKNPNTLKHKVLQKGFLSGIKNISKKIKGFIGRGSRFSPFKPFKIKGMKIYRKGKPLTQREWVKFEKQVSEYLQPHLDTIAEDLSVKGLLMSLATMQAESQGKDINKYGKKSFEQIEKEEFKGVIPSNISAAQKRFNLTDYITDAMHLSNSRIADYVSDISSKTRTAIKKQVEVAHKTNKSHTELASDLYWQHHDNKDLRLDNEEIKKHTAEAQMKDWRRIAHTELSMIHEHGKMMSTESKAEKSFKGKGKPVYLVFNGPGKCEWCNSHLGTITRQIPLELVGNEKDDSLQSRGIDDPVTNVAVWAGKNNVGFNKQGWRVAVPVHPWCDDSLSIIDIDTQEYDKKNKRIKLKPNKTFDQFIDDDFLKEIETENAKYQARLDLMEKDRNKGIHKRDSAYYN